MCVLSTFLKANDDTIIPRHANPNHALMKVGNDGNSVFSLQNRITMWIWFSDACCALMAPEMVISNPVTQVQRLYYRPDNIKSNCCFHITHCSWRYVKVSFVSKQSQCPKCFQQRRTSAQPTVAGDNIQNCRDFRVTEW